mmetsp:Transcript_17294/g.60794  ORF Transcript_17294/g.60794 Transcript_17294/m.60794 type:complete len:206 (+) Transcript_17294:166-783(+)
MVGSALSSDVNKRRLRDGKMPNVAMRAWSTRLGLSMEMGCAPPAYVDVEPSGCAWPWLGRLASTRVTLSVPSCSPMVRGVRPAPAPLATMARPRRSGNPNVVSPSPPNIVPSTLKSAEFCEIAMSWPAASAEPRGQKFPPKAKTRPRSWKTPTVAMQNLTARYGWRRWTEMPPPAPDACMPSTLCDGICCDVSVSASAPPFWPIR